MLRSVGYKGNSLDEVLPFDHQRGTIDNDGGGCGEGPAEWVGELAVLTRMPWHRRASSALRPR